jgi:hypothetical protein
MMTPYKHLLSKGLEVEARGDLLSLKPAEKVTEEITQYALTHKQVILQELHRIEEWVLNMTLKELPISSVAIQVHSKVLGEDIYVCTDEAIKAMVKEKGLVVYLPHELKIIHEKKRHQQDLIVRCEIKKTFNGGVKHG